MMTVELSESRTWSAEVEPNGLELRVLGGTVWVTQEADPEDHVLGATGRFVTYRAGRVAIQALTPASVEVAVPASGSMAAAA
jgi:hypothetical protein